MSESEKSNISDECAEQTAPAEVVDLSQGFDSDGWDLYNVEFQLKTWVWVHFPLTSLAVAVYNSRVVSRIPRRDRWPKRQRSRPRRRLV